MSRERVTMRKTREILRLVWSCNQSRRDTARTCGVGKSTVNATIRDFLNEIYNQNNQSFPLDARIIFKVVWTTFGLPDVPIDTLVERL